MTKINFEEVVIDSFSFGYVYTNKDRYDKVTKKIKSIMELLFSDLGSYPDVEYFYNDTLNTIQSVSTSFFVNQFIAFPENNQNKKLKLFEDIIDKFCIKLRGHCLANIKFYAEEEGNE